MAMVEKEENLRVRKKYRRYWVQFIFRIAVFLLTAGYVLYCPEKLSVLEGMNFFREFSLLHLLWLLWVWYMVERLLPVGFGQHRGSMKYRKSQYCPTKEYEARAQSEGQWEGWQHQRIWYTKGAVSVFVLWALVGLGLFMLHRFGILGNGSLLILTALFYVGDMVCILIWCPFRHFLMKNRCCTQCRIYNWDTWMMILPLFSVRGFFTYSLLALALAATGVWEINHLRYPERYYPLTNENIICTSCKGEPGCYLVRKNNSLWWFLKKDEEEEQKVQDGTDESV